MKTATSKTKFKKVILNKNAYQNPWHELYEYGIIKINNDAMSGKKGVSRNPKWDGEWDGNYWTNSSIELTDLGIELLKETSISNFEIQ